MENEYKQNLLPELSYYLGKFQIILNEDTGDLRVLVHTNKDHLQITPKSGNSILIHACK